MRACTSGWSVISETVFSLCATKSLTRNVSPPGTTYGFDCSNRLVRTPTTFSALLRSATARSRSRATRRDCWIVTTRNAAAIVTKAAAATTPQR